MSVTVTVTKGGAAVTRVAVTVHAAVDAAGSRARPAGHPPKSAAQRQRECRARKRAAAAQATVTVTQVTGNVTSSGPARPDPSLPPPCHPLATLAQTVHYPWHPNPTDQEPDMSALCMTRQAASTVRHLRNQGLRAQARSVAFEARRAIGAAALRRSVA